MAESGQANDRLAKGKKPGESVSPGWYASREVERATSSFISSKSGVPDLQIDASREEKRRKK